MRNVCVWQRRADSHRARKGERYSAHFVQASLDLKMVAADTSYHRIHARVVVHGAIAIDEAQNEWSKCVCALNIQK